MPFLHAHRRRVPTQDVDCSIVIGVSCEATMATKEARLAFAALPVYGSTFRTGLRGIGRVYFRKRPAAFFEFIGEDRFERSPALIENASVQTGFGADASPRFFGRSFCARGHIADFQVFENDDAEAIGNVQSCPMCPVLSDACNTRRETRGASQRFRPPCGAPLLSRQCTLRPTLASLYALKRRRHTQVFTRGERQRISDATVNADRGVGIRRNRVFNLTGKANGPAECIKNNGCVLDLSAQWSRVAKVHPADFRQTHGGPLAVEPLRFDLPALKAEGVVYALVARRRITGATRKEVPEGFVQISQSLLLTGLRDRGNPVIFGTQGCKFTRLCYVIEFAPGLALKMPEPVSALLKSNIVDQSAYARELPEPCFLFRSRVKLVSEPAKDHLSALGLWSGKMAENTDIRKGRHVVYALHAHLVFVTKYRRDALSELAIRDLTRIFAKVCRDFEADLIECNGEDDHVHLLIVYPPKVALSKLVNSLKGVSSRLLREWRPEVRGRYKNSVLWSPSYFVASCGGAPLNIIAEYVKSQRDAPSGRSRLPPRPEGRGCARGY